MGLRRRITVWTVGLTGVVIATMVLSATIGPVRIPPDVVAKVLLNRLVVPVGLDHGNAGPSRAVLPAGIEFARPFAFDVPETRTVIVWQIRLPRIVLGALVGLSLALAGGVMQGFFRNPMADPSIIGVSAGAAFGAVVVIAAPVAFAAGLGLQTAAFAGGIVAAFAVYLIATRNGRTPVATLLLAGVAVQTFLGAAISYVLLHSGENLTEAVYWLMGHLHYASWEKVRITALVVPPLVAVLLLYSRDLNVLLLGEEEAHNLGVAVERTKRILLAVSSLLTAAAVAVSGVIGFVGLVVPHMMRLVVGPDHRVLLPTSALAGAAFLVATDTIARSGPAEVPVGIVTAAVGAPFFLFLLRRREVPDL